MVKPDWLKVRIPQGENYENIKEMLGELKLATVCQEALCPNIAECWKGGTATFMLMGDTCTRACRFCAVKTGNPKGMLDADEPEKVGHAISQMKLNYVVLTSVDRDDLEDYGAHHIAQSVEVIKRYNPSMKVEVLSPDFSGKISSIKRVVTSGLDVFAHNIETVERLTPLARDRRSGYTQSLNVLETVKSIDPHKITKSSIMLGIGEKDDEVEKALIDLRSVACDVVTFGQYLSPTKRHDRYLPIYEYVKPDRFDHWGTRAREMGFLYVASGPLVRSSYKAGEYFLANMIEKQRLATRLLEAKGL